MPYKDKEKEREYKKKWNQEHKEERKTKYICPCGSSYSMSNRSHHQGTLKHVKYEIQKFVKEK